jgi:Icc-related predicted phosphoesterase
MSKLAILADIHGNLPALEAVIRDIDAQGGVDQVVVAGDVVNWGPFSAAVMARVSREDWAVIRGNNEYYLLEYNTPRQPEHWKNFALLPWLYEQLEGNWHRLIATWPDELSLRYPDAPPIRVFHASPAAER